MIQMKENIEFREIQEEIERTQKPKRRRKSKEEDDGQLAGIPEHVRLLRGVIQEKLESNPEETKEQEVRAKLLSELMTPELMSEYKAIMAGFKAKGEITEEHKEREWISVEGKEIEEQIEKWISDLVREIKTKSPDFKPGDQEDTRHSSWWVFQSVGNVLNTKNLTADIRLERSRIEEESRDKKTFETREEIDIAIAEKLAERYPFSKEDVSILASAVDPKEEEYNMRILAEMVGKVWKEYRPNLSKKDIAMLSGGHLATAMLEGFTPSLWLKLFPEGGGFDLPVFLQMTGLEKVREIIDNRLDILIDKIELEVKKKINARISDTVFYQEFEFMQEHSQGEIFESLEEGRDATLEILKNTTTKFAPMIGSIAASVGFMTSINPVMGGASVASLPAMYYIAKKRKDRFWEIRREGYRERSKYVTKINSIKDSFEEVRTSSQVPSIAGQFTDTANTIDQMQYKTSKISSKYALLEAIPRDATTLTAGLVGYGLHKEGLVPSGAVLANIQYAHRLQAPIEKLVSMYFRDFPQAIQKIKRMEKMLSNYENLDTPDKKKKKNRIPVSELKDFSISIKDLTYKGILKKINLEIPQGEFIVLGGRSGSGKTTFIRNMIGVLKPQGGEVKFGGEKADKIKKFGSESLYAALAYSSQKPKLFPEMSLRENLLLWQKEGATDERIKSVLESLNLGAFGERLDEHVTTMSGGELVRLGVARSLLKNPKILFLDEPTSSLDSQSAEEVRSILKKLHVENPDIPIIFASHDEELKKQSDRSLDLADLQGR